MRKLALLIAAPLLLAACAQSANTPSAGGKADYAGSAPAPAADAASGYSGVASTTANQGIPTVVVTADRNLILTAEILKVDASLSNVRTQIEQLTGQINSIKQRTDFSTISMSIATIAVLPGDTTTKAWDPAKTVTRALAALGAMLQVFADVVIWLFVFGWLPLLALAAVVLVTRARRPAAPPAPTA